MSVNVVVTGEENEVLDFIRAVGDCRGVDVPAEQVTGVDSLPGQPVGVCAVQFTGHVSDGMDALAARIREVGFGQTQEVGWEAAS